MAGHSAKPLNRAATVRERSGPVRETVQLIRGQYTSLANCSTVRLSSRRSTCGLVNAPNASSKAIAPEHHSVPLCLSTSTSHIAVRNLTVRLVSELEQKTQLIDSAQPAFGCYGCFIGMRGAQQAPQKRGKEDTTMKRFSIREVETLKTTHALYGVLAKTVCP
jgi:hypothetical protein